METYGYIYISTNKINGKRYIGKHKSKVWDSDYYGSGKILKQAIMKYGKEYFTCFPLAWAWNKNELNQLEIDYIAHYKPEYNLSKGGDGGPLMAGRKHSEETKIKMSKARKGIIFSDETRNKISEAVKNRTEEIKKKISESCKGKNKGKISPMKDKHHSEETKIKMSIVKQNMSEETRKKMSIAKQNMSEETKKKISEARKRYWKMRREKQCGKKS